MISNDTLIFLGIALSILLIFVVVHKSANNEGNDLYSTILDEIRSKIRKAVEALTEKHNVQERIENIKESLREGATIIGWEDSDSGDSEKKRLASTQSMIERARRSTEKCEGAFRRFKEMNPIKEASPLLSQAPLFTALFCLLVVGMQTYVAVSSDNKGSLAGYVEPTILTFTYFCILYWVSVWMYRLFVNEFRLLPAKKSAAGRFLSAYRRMMKRWTTLGTIRLLAVIFLAWFLLFPLLRALHCSRVHLGIGFFFVLLGSLGFHAKDYRKGIPYLNLYGQIVVILAVSILTSVCTRRFGMDVFPKAMLSAHCLDKAVFHFVFLNGFTLPILLPLVYYHCRIWISEMVLLGRIRLLEQEHKRVITRFLTDEEEHTDVPS